MGWTQTKRRTFTFDPGTGDDPVQVVFRTGDDGLISVSLRDPQGIMRQVLYEGPGASSGELAFMPAERS